MRVSSPSPQAPHARRDGPQRGPAGALSWLGLPARELALVAAVAAALVAAIVGFGAVALSRASAPAPAAVSRPLTAPTSSSSNVWPRDGWSVEDGPGAPAPRAPGLQPPRPPAAPSLTHLVSTAQEFSP